MSIVLARSQVKVNVIDPRHHHDQQRQKERLRLPAAAGEEPADLSDPEASLAAAETRALVPSHASGNMRKLGKLDVDMDGGGVYFESARGGRRDVLSEGGDASNRPRRRGPTPIHGAVNSGEECCLSCLCARACLLGMDLSSSFFFSDMRRDVLCWRH